LQGCEGQTAHYDGYYYDVEVCSKDGIVASDWTSYLLIVVVWALVVAAVSGYAGFRYAGLRDPEWLLVPPEPDTTLKEMRPADMVDTTIPSVPASSVMTRPSQMRRSASTQSQTTHKWKWAAPRFQPVQDHAHGVFLEVRVDNARGLFLD
jgi:hypothetical protein